MVYMCPHVWGDLHANQNLVYSPAGPWSESFLRLSLCFVGFGRGNRFSWRRLEYTSEAGAPTLFLSLGTHTQCLFPPQLWPQQAQSLWSIVARCTAGKERKDRHIKCHWYFFPTSHSIAVDAAIQTNDLIYSFWELLKKKQSKPQVTWDAAVMCFSSSKKLYFVKTK